MLSLLRSVRNTSPYVYYLARPFSSSVATATPHAKDPDQRMFDKNKRKLEKLEHEGHEAMKDFKRPSINRLKKKGENAQIEQGRADDGVY